jgi:hypothetical protein
MTIKRILVLANSTKHHPRSCVACRELIDEGSGKTPGCGSLFPHRENRQFIQESFFF